MRRDRCDVNDATQSIDAIDATQILWKRPFYNMIRPKNVQEQEKHDFVICPPILKNFQNVKINKSISDI